MSAQDRTDQRVTTKLSGERLEFFETVKADEGADSNAEAMRAIVDRARAHADAQGRVDELEARVNELQAELRAANQRIDAANDLVEYVEHEREVERDRREWERKRRTAGILTRAKWLLVGANEDDLPGGS